MNILVSVNDHYLMPLLVMLTSLFEHCTGEISIWFMAKSTSEQAIQAVADFVTAHGARFHMLAVRDDFFSDMPTAKYISKETYYRLFAAQLLPTEMDRVLWLDADLVITGDISPLYNMPLGDHAVGGNGHTGAIYETEMLNCRSLGIEPDKYINAGVMLMQLSRWRRRNIRGEISAIISQGYPLNYADQDLVNLIFKEEIAYFPPEYNFRVRKICSDEDFQWARENASVLHYCGRMKPWMFTDMPLGDIWMSYYEKSPYSSRKLHRISSASLSRLVTRYGDQKDDN